MKTLLQAGTHHRHHAQAAKCKLRVLLAFAIVWRKTWPHDHERAITNIDWVIEMLHRVRREKPPAVGVWWDSLRHQILGTRQSKAPSNRPHSTND
jgi:hypothetical protein